MVQVAITLEVVLFVGEFNPALGSDVDVDVGIPRTHRDAGTN